MGDKGGKKSKEKILKQKTAAHEKEARKSKEKQDSQKAAATK